MPEYRYIFADARTDQTLDVLPMYGVTFSDMLSKAGDFTGTIRTDYENRTPLDILNATRPGRVKLWIERDKVLVWGGLIWSRTYSSDGRSLQLTGQTFASYPAKVVNEITNTLTQEPQNHIIDIWTVIQSKGDDYNLGVVLPLKTTDIATRTTQQIYKSSDQYFYDRFIDEMVGRGAEYRIRVYRDESGRRTAAMDVGIFDVERPQDRVGAPVDATQTVFQYPGNISEYWVTENAAKSAKYGYATGNPNGDAPIYTTYENPVAPTDAFAFDFQKQYTLITTQSALLAALTHDVNALYTPVVQFTCHLAGDIGLLDSWTLGDYATFIVNDPYRFPEGPGKGSFRLTGWELHPSASDGVEQLYLTIGYPDQLLVSGTDA